MKSFDRAMHTIIALENIPIIWDIFTKQGQISWAKIGFLATSILLLYLFWFLHYRKEQRRPAETTNSLPVSRLLDDQVNEIAKIRLDELAETAQFLVRRAPTKGDNDKTLCLFWTDSVHKWRDDVIRVLQSRWGANTVADFADADGFNKHEPVGSILPDAADGYREILHCQRNLKNIRRTL